MNTGMNTTANRRYVSKSTNNGLGVGGSSSYSHSHAQPTPPPPPPQKTHRSKSGGYDIPQAYAEDDHMSASRRSQLQRRSSSKNRGVGGNSRGCCRSLCGCLFKSVCLLTILGSAGYFLLPHIEEYIVQKHMSEQERLLQEQEMELSIQYDSKISKLKKENEDLTKHRADEKQLKIRNQQLVDEKKRMEEEKKRLEVQIQNIKKQHKEAGDGADSKLLQNEVNKVTTSRKKLRENIKLMSRTALIEKYGHGPHFVEILVQFDSHQGKNDQGLITIRLATVEQLPHAVYWFLEQVQRKLYDGCSFYRNPGHVLQGGMQPNFLSPPKQQLKKRFEDSGFNSILFQEYSEKFPHEKFTIGYAGRPGGPEFYISMRDNTKIHGPGGQANYLEDKDEADTCFAKVVNGFDVVERIYKEPKKEGSSELQSYVAIVSMKIKQ